MGYKKVYFACNKVHFTLLIWLFWVTKESVSGYKRLFKVTKESVLGYESFLGYKVYLSLHGSFSSPNVTEMRATSEFLQSWAAPMNTNQIRR